jgi:thiol:disulfide interchange protein
MPSWLELLVLALASTFWPTLILIVVLALRLDRPVKILVWFLIGGLLTTVSVGIAVVFALQDASFMTGSHPPADSAVDIVAGLLSLLAAFALSRRSRKTPAEVTPAPPEAPAEPKKPSMAQRAVSQGSPIAFVAGVVLNIVPGTFPIVALKDIAQLDASDGAKIATIIAFYVIMFAFVEIPIVAYLFAPARTITAVDNFNAWLGRNGRRVAVYVLAVVGAYLIARGVVQLLS